MKTSDLNRRLLDLECQGTWLFDLVKLRIIFPEECDATLRSAIRRMLDNGSLVSVAHGLYARPVPGPRPSNALGTLVNHLRPMDITYLSLESRLSELGVISQVPSVATFVTTGRSGRFETGLGAIEFVHTKRAPSTFRSRLEFDEGRGYYLADPALAYQDLRYTRRNLDLVDADELDEVIAEAREETDLGGGSFVFS